MIKKFFFFIAVNLMCLIIFSCASYSPINDKKVVSDKKLLENEWKFTLTVYYNNPNTFFDMPLELGQIRDGEYECSATQVFYERSFYHFLSEVFTSPPSVIKDRDLQETYLYTVTSLCDVKNRNGDILFWYSYDDGNSENPYMLLNGRLIEKNDRLISWTKMLLDSSENVVLP